MKENIDEMYWVGFLNPESRVSFGIASTSGYVMLQPDLLIFDSEETAKIVWMYATGVSYLNGGDSTSYRDFKIHKVKEIKNKDELSIAHKVIHSIEEYIKW